LTNSDYLLSDLTNHEFGKKVIGHVINLAKYVIRRIVFW